MEMPLWFWGLKSPLHLRRNYPENPNQFPCFNQACQSKHRVPNRNSTLKRGADPNLAHLPAKNSALWWKLTPGRGTGTCWPQTQVFTFLTSLPQELPSSQKPCSSFSVWLRLSRRTPLGLSPGPIFRRGTPSKPRFWKRPPEGLTYTASPKAGDSKISAHSASSEASPWNRTEGFCPLLPSWHVHSAGSPCQPLSPRPQRPFKTGQTAVCLEGSQQGPKATSGLDPLWKYLPGTRGGCY